MSKNFSIQDIQSSACGRLNDHLIEKPIEKKISKYGNSKKVVDEIEYHSIKEATRYKQLKLKVKYGHIGFLRLQVPYELNAGGSHSLVYIADFVYRDAVTGLEIVEDVKGHKTAVYLKKRRLMKKVHGIIIKET